MFRIVFLAAMALCWLPAQASNWKVFESRGNVQINFYDADTLEKHGDTITLWRKIVYDENSSLIKDGIYARALRITFDCKKKTFQALEASFYDKNHKFIKADKVPDPETTPEPNTVNEAVLEEVCARGFPPARAPVKNNDVYGYAKYIFEGARKDSAPQ